jgi:hypothetical protein
VLNSIVNNAHAGAVDASEAERERKLTKLTTGHLERGVGREVVEYHGLAIGDAGVRLLK